MHMELNQKLLFFSSKILNICFNSSLNLHQKERFYQGGSTVAVGNHTCREIKVTYIQQS